MQKQRLWDYSRFILPAWLVAFLGASTAFATSSSHYQLTETGFGAGSTNQTCSSQYCSKTSIGDMATGGGASTNYSATFGPVTGTDPLLEVIINPGVSNLGDFSSTATATKTTVVKIRSYLSSGYILQIVGDPPKISGHTLTALSLPTASTPGVEQFGINAVANTSPNIGAAPVQVPSSQFSYGVVNSGYNTANLFKYVSGDTVAHSSVASGETDYTISVIVNISNTTPAGHYTADYAAVVVPVY